MTAAESALTLDALLQRLSAPIPKGAGKLIPPALGAASQRHYYVVTKEVLQEAADRHALEIFRSFRESPDLVVPRPLVVPDSTKGGISSESDLHALVVKNQRAKNSFPYRLRAWMTTAWLAGTQLSDREYRFSRQPLPDELLRPFVLRLPVSRNSVDDPDGSSTRVMLTDVTPTPKSDSPKDLGEPLLTALQDLSRSRFLEYTMLGQGGDASKHTYGVHNLKIRNQATSLTWEDRYRADDRPRHIYDSVEDVQSLREDCYYRGRETTDGREHLDRWIDGFDTFQGEPARLRQFERQLTFDMYVWDDGMESVPTADRPLGDPESGSLVPSWVFKFNWMARLSLYELLAVLVVCTPALPHTEGFRLSEDDFELRLEPTSVARLQGLRDGWIRDGLRALAERRLVSIEEIPPAGARQRRMEMVVTAGPSWGHPPSDWKGERIQ